jgi:P4 family phage/plasmid primase-like protien
MSSPSKVKQYIIDQLNPMMNKLIYQNGYSDEKVNKKTEAEMGQYFERYITGNDGDKINQLILVAESGEPYAFNGKFFEAITPEMLQYIVKRIMADQSVGVVYRFNSHKKISDECLLALMQEPSCKFDPDRRYIVFNNVVLDMEEGKLLEHDAKYKTDMVFDFDYDPKAVSGLWDKFMAETVQDVGMRQAFQMFCGAFLANRKKYKIEHICLLVGTGLNGKSVMAEAIVGLFNKQLKSVYSPEQLFKSSQKEYYLADIDGKVVNYCDDVSNKDFSGGDFKAFTSGAEFAGRHAYSRRPMKVSRVPLMICNVNEIPPTTDDTDGYYRRLLPIVCPNVITEDKIDTSLSSKLSTPQAKQAIFNWLMEGYKMLVANNGKISISDSIKNVKEVIKNESNSVRRWLFECEMYAVVPEGKNDIRWKSLSEWMSIYQDYCKKYNECPKSQKSVSKVFKDMKFATERRCDGTWFCIGKKSESYGGSPILPNNEDEEEIPF